MSGKPGNRAILFDMDGTLANVSTIRHHVAGPKRDFHRFHSESIDAPPHPEIVDLARYVHEKTPYHTLIVTARDERYAPLTLQWLHEQGIPYTDAYFRRSGDTRPDVAVKEDLLVNHIRKLYQPFAAVDDNPAVLPLWRRHGLSVIEVPGFS
jgi:phosphoglycolate phosphatase-like HAD superfamily hydrolase